jgi:hypothetical protein
VADIQLSKVKYLKLATWHDSSADELHDDAQPPSLNGSKAQNTPKVFTMMVARATNIIKSFLEIFLRIHKRVQVSP